MLGGVAALLNAENNSSEFTSEILSLAINAASDSVPNIRYILAQAVKNPNISEDLVGQIRPVISSLASGDKDKDVKYFASEAQKCF